MKELRMKVKEAEERRKEDLNCMEDINLRSDWFKCSRCGHTVRMLAYGDTERCSQCGGTMYRI